MNARQLALLIRAIKAGGRLQLSGREPLTARALARRDLCCVTRTTKIEGRWRPCPPTLLVYPDIMALAAALRRSE